VTSYLGTCATAVQLWSGKYNQERVLSGRAPRGAQECLRARVL